MNGVEATVFEQTASLRREKMSLYLWSGERMYRSLQSEVVSFARRLKTEQKKSECVVIGICSFAPRAVEACRTFRRTERVSSCILYAGSCILFEVAAA